LAVCGHFQPAFAAVISVVAVSLVATLLGPILLSLDPFSFLLSTFGLEIAFIDIARNSEWTGGPLGIRGIPFPSWFSVGESTSAALAPLVLGLTLSVVAGSVLFGYQRPWGIRYHAVRDDRDSAEALGIHPEHHLRQAFVIHALLASLAGLGATIAQGYIGPNSFGVDLCLAVLAAVLLSGSGARLPWMFLGAILLIGVGEVVAASMSGKPEAVGPLQQILYNAILILVLVLRKRGLLGPVLEEGPSSGVER
jgi:branched-chain amino acid transport system permease protein